MCLFILVVWWSLFKVKMTFLFLVVLQLMYLQYIVTHNTSHCLITSNIYWTTIIDHYERSKERGSIVFDPNVWLIFSCQSNETQVAYVNSFMVFSCWAKTSTIETNSHCPPLEPSTPIPKSKSKSMRRKHATCCSWSYYPLSQPTILTQSKMCAKCPWAIDAQHNVNAISLKKTCCKRYWRWGKSKSYHLHLEMPNEFNNLMHKLHCATSLQFVVCMCQMPTTIGNLDSLILCSFTRLIKCY
jgi:hypothetical protein